MGGPRSGRAAGRGGANGESERRERAPGPPRPPPPPPGDDLGGCGRPWLAARARAAAGRGSEGRGSRRPPPRLREGRERAAADVR